MKKEVRISAGILRGRKILTPGAGTHPMGKRERLALFNMITPHLVRAEVLDAFSGSGALGIEAFSRGARHVVFVESAPGAVSVIRENLRELGLLEDSEVFQGRVRDFARDFVNLGRKFDVVLADPPYDNFQVSEVESLTGLVKDGGILVLSHPEDAPLFSGLVLEKTRTYARSHISIYVK